MYIIIIHQLTSQFIIITPGALSLPGNTKGWFKWEECSCTIILLMMWGGEVILACKESGILAPRLFFSWNLLKHLLFWWKSGFKIHSARRNSKMIVKPVRIAAFCMLPCKVIRYTQDILSKHLMLLLRHPSQGPVAGGKKLLKTFSESDYCAEKRLTSLPFRI